MGVGRRRRRRSWFESREVTPGNVSKRHVNRSRTVHLKTAAFLRLWMCRRSEVQAVQPNPS